MANKLIFIENHSYRSLDQSKQAHLVVQLKSIPGAQCRLFKSIPDYLDSQFENNCVFCIPVMVPDHQKIITETYQYLRHKMPLPYFIGVQFVILTHSPSFNAFSLSQAEWIETLDQFYDQAIPVAFVVWGQEKEIIEAFHMRSMISGLFRDLDSFDELRKLHASVKNLEEQMSKLTIES